MDVGIGLPTTIPGFVPSQVTAWAHKAERHALASLGMTDRLVYDNTEPLITAPVRTQRDTPRTT